jgi:uncharacterized protein (TIGR02301 family)
VSRCSPGASLRAAVAAILLLNSTPLALAAGPPLPPQRPVQPDETAAPYDTLLLRLAEILGSLSYLNAMCAPGRGDPFHDKMEALIEAEATTPTRRAEFAGAYNRGSRGLAASYARCTDNARALMRRLRAEGATITRQLRSQYGG